MDIRKIWMALLLAAMVFGWSVAMAAMGHVALIAALAPILGLTVNQVLRGHRPRPTPAAAPTRGATAPGNGSAPGAGDGTP
ncbi:hypothetical protein [Streptomyces solincola]|nr:hypothetical protein [Streptomyces solincola]